VIKINLVREGRAVRGATGAPAAAATGAVAGASGNLNNLLIVGLLVVALVVSGGWWLLKQRTLADKDEQVRTRKQDADRLESIIKDVAQYQTQKDNLQKRIDLINQLKQNQKGPVRIMDQISKDLPDLVWIDSMMVDPSRITLVGRGLNPNAIANFVSNIKDDPYFEEPNVGDITQVSASPLVYSFNMDFAFSYAPKAPAAAGAPGAPTTSAGTTSTSGTASTTTRASKK
jgi:type IV pilus assembly protein PilN